MGLMDMLGKAAGGDGSLFGAVTSLVTQHEGGLGGLLGQLKAGGLGQQVESWVGTGANLPVSADQIKAALGAGKLGQIASAAGISQDEAAAAVAQHLPKVVDKLTPEGTVPAGNMEGQVMALLKSKFFG